MVPRDKHTYASNPAAPWCDRMALIGARFEMGELGAAVRLDQQNVTTLARPEATLCVNICIKLNEMECC